MTKTNNTSWWKVRFGIAKRDSSIEIARFIMACTIFFTHITAFESLQEGHLIFAKALRTLGGMCTISFAALSGYYLIKSPSKGRWLKVLFTMAILLILNWLIEVIGLSIRGSMWITAHAGDRVTFHEFFSHPMGTHGWLNQLLVGNPIHWYMWQFAIAMVIFPVLAHGVLKMSKKGSMAFIVGLLILEVVIKLLVMAGFHEFTLGGFIEHYGNTDALKGGMGSKFAGYNWMLLVIMMLFAGWFRIHYKGQENKKGMLWFLVAFVIIIVVAIIWKYSNKEITNKTIPLGSDGKPLTGVEKTWWFARQYTVHGSYGTSIMGTFFESGNYIPVAALLGSISIFLGIIHLPKTDLNWGRFLGGISYAFYFLHRDAMSWSAYIFEHALGFDGKNILDGKTYGFGYLASNMLAWIFAIPPAIAGTYATRLAMKVTNPWWEKHFNKKEKIKKEVEQ